MKIAILGAMNEEIVPILKKLGSYKTTDYAKNTFYEATFGAHELVLAYSKIGKVNSALTATILFEKFGCEMLFFTGVAGALDAKLRIGDLIFATKTTQYDLDISVFGHPKGFVPGGAVFVETDARLNELAKGVAKKLGVGLGSGVIASGDKFVCDEASKSAIASEFGAAAVEMEGASVAVVCDALNKPFFLLRSVSDEAGGGAEFDFDKFVEESARVSADFVLEMVSAF